MPHGAPDLLHREAEPRDEEDLPLVGELREGRDVRIESLRTRRRRFFGLSQRPSVGVGSDSSRKRKLLVDNPPPTASQN